MSKIRFAPSWVLVPLWILAIVSVIILLPVILAGMICVAVLMWACGVPIGIKSDGKKIGHIRWFTFYHL